MYELIQDSDNGNNRQSDNTDINTLNNINLSGPPSRVVASMSISSDANLEIICKRNAEIESCINPIKYKSAQGYLSYTDLKDNIKIY